MSAANRIRINPDVGAVRFAALNAPYSSGLSRVLEYRLFGPTLPI